MQLSIQVDLGQGPFIVTTNLWVQIQWERKFKTKLSELANGVGMEDIAYMAFEACKTSGVVVPAVYDDFIRRASVELVDQDTPVPTNPAPTAGH